MHKILFLFFLLPLSCFAQTDSMVSKNIFTKLERYSANHVVEKVYLHLDKPYYAAGDTIYFKAYLTLGNQHVLSARSGVLHVELIDNNTNKIKQSENLEVTNGVTWGDFALSDSLSKASYRLRAYTRSMRNEGGFFEQNIPIGAVHVPKESKTNAGTVAANKPDLQFFPEGGNLVSGIKSKVAFKAIGSNGLGTMVKGEVVDNENKPICTFTSTHLGMGYFYLMPENNKAYKAKVTYANGAQDMVSLPTADDNGISLSVNNDSLANAVMNIAAGKSCYQKNKNKDYTLAIYSNGKLTNIIFKLDTPVVTGGLYKRGLHSGITRLTLFSPTGEALCERLVFIQNDDLLKLSVSSDKESYAKREKVTIKLNAFNPNSRPVKGDFSVSVTDEGKVPVDEGNESTILNNLLLTSDLKGKVEQPNYYFSSNLPEVQANLDVLMLTQGYRHFEWKAVLNDQTPAVIYKPENLLNVSGTVKTYSGKIVPNGEVNLANIKQLIARDTTADANGHFNFNNLYIIDTAKLFLRPGKKNKNGQVTIDKPDFPEIAQVSATDTSNATITPQIAVEMQKRYQQQGGSMKKGIVLQQVNIKSKGQKNPSDDPWKPKLEHSSNLNGPGDADQIIMGDKLMGCVNLADCLVSVIHGVRIAHNNGVPVFYSLHTPVALSGATKPMAVQLDGIIEDQSVLDEVSYTDVYSIEILSSSQYSAIYGSEGSGGLIVITTKRGSGSLSLVALAPGLTTYSFNGFYKAREFYSPKYEAGRSAGTIRDVRTTIFWKPVVITDKFGKATFDYYNADGTGNYRVVVEGIDDKGNIGRQVYHYKVE